MSARAATGTESSLRDPVPARRAGSLLLVLALATAGCGTLRDTVDARPPDDAAAPDASVALDAAPAPDARADASADTALAAPLRVLFVGNSYTYVNDLPAVVRALGDATPGAPIEVDSVTVGGATLGDHWQTTGARARIEAGGFGAVVLQGQSTEPVLSPDNFYAYAQLLGGAVQAQRARALWYATWARRAGDPFYAAWGGTPAQMSSGLDFAYREAARQWGGFVARVGAAWDVALAEQPAVNLYADDGSHPSPAGTLLAACVMFRALTGRDAVLPDPPPLGVPRATAEALCAIAPRVECAAGLTRCGDRCASIASDPMHCGACDARCDAPRVCSAGACGCRRAESVTALFRDLSAFDPACDGAGERYGLECSRAVHRFCAARGCAQSGFGPISQGGDFVWPTCVAGAVQHTTYTSLRALEPACDGVAQRAGAECGAAIHRHCVAAGALSGFGPVESSGDALDVTCVPRDAGVVLRTTWSELDGVSPGCDGVTQRAGLECAYAAHTVCHMRGHVSGFGPVESAGGDASVVCVDM